MEDSSKDLDEGLFTNFKSLTVRDHETGETLCVGRDVETGEASTQQWATGAVKKKTGFRIPFMFLKRDTSWEDCDGMTLDKPRAAASNFVPSICNSASPFMETVTTDDVLVAEVPGPKLSSLFCRKRKNAAEPDAKAVVKPAEGAKCMVSCKLPRFLEGREGLLRAIQLFLVALSLVSPGFFFPVIFIIKLMCHYREHQENWDLNINEQLGEHPACYLTQEVCRVCRERRNTERMMKVHSSMATEDGLRSRIAENNICQSKEDCSFCN